MGLRDALRNAEQQGRAAAHRGLERARDGWEDAERRLRRKMRIFPSSFKHGKSSFADGAPGQSQGVEAEGNSAAASAKKHAA